MLPQVEGVTFQLHPEFPDYAIGDDGSVWSIKFGEWRKRKLQYCHYSLSLTLESKYNRFVHRLVLEAFVGPCPDGMEACHNDGDFRNNQLSNLRWDTHKSNCVDRDQHGTTAQGEKCNHNKITPEQVQSIKTDYDTGSFTQLQLADKYGVGKGVISDVIRCRTWKHLLQVDEKQIYSEKKKIHKLGERNGNSKLVEGDVLRIRQLYREGYKRTELVTMFQISQSSISKIVCYKSWKHVA